MGRIFSKANAAPDGDVMELPARERHNVQRHSVREDRDAEMTREDVRIEIDPARWVGGVALEAPPPRPGYVQRWILDGTTQNAPGERSWHKRIREGWEPRNPESVSEAQRRLFPPTKAASGADVIRSGHLILCEMPRQIANQRKLAIQDRTTHNTKSIPQSVQELTRGRAGVGPVTAEDQETSLRGRRAATMTD